MGIKDTSQIKFRPDLPYMTVSEANLFKTLLDAGSITVFRTGTCQGVKDVDGAETPCEADIPTLKQYCSRACYESRKVDGDGTEDGGEGGTGDDGEG